MFTNPSRQRLIERLEKINNSLKITDLRKVLANLRMVKEPYEIEMIKQAIDYTSNIFEIIENNLNEADYEHDLMAEITRYAVQNQLVFAYEPIIASGLNAVTLHYVKNNAFLDKKSLLLLDIGLKYRGYSADITRTVGWASNSRQHDVYEAVLNVQNHAISLLKPGVKLRDYEKKVQQRMKVQLKKLGLISAKNSEQKQNELVRKYYPHSTSHFLGLDVHDVGDYERQLEPGMVLTVEPGIYIQDEAIGVRIEDDILITKNGNEILSKQLPRRIDSLTINA